MNRKIIVRCIAFAASIVGALQAWAFTSDDYVQDGLVAMWDCGSNVDGTTWSDTTGTYPFTFTKDVKVAEDGGLLFEADASYYATLTSGDTTSTFYQGRNGTLEVAVKRASTDGNVCVFQSSPASGHELFFIGAYGVHACSVQNLTGNYFTSYPQTTDFTTFTAQYTNAVAACAVMANGIRQAFNDTTTEYYTQPNTDTRLGIRGNKTASYAFDGTLYCIRVYSRRLTPTEIARNCAIDRARFASACERTVTATDYGTETELTENGAKFKVLAFTNTAADGFSWTVPENVSSIDLLVVGGGGSGGSSSSSWYYHAAGGGGAGGLVYETGLEVTPGETYAIHVGAGGAATAPSGTGGSHGNAGSDSSFGDFYVAKGGGGGKYGGTAAGVAGGSGGGPSGGNYAAGAATQPTQPCGGHGNASGAATTKYGAGSGGGAGSVGRGSAGGRIALGGDGMTIAITGDPLVYACGGNSGIGGWSAESSLVEPPNDMTSKIVKYAPVAGRDGYGDGGAAAVGKSLPSAKGGDGVVVVRYALPVGITVESNWGAVGEPDPGYGPHQDRCVVGQSYTFTCPVEVKEEGVSWATLEGYQVVRVSDQQVVDSGKGATATVVYSDPVKLVWQWRMHYPLTVSSTGPGGVSGADAWYEAGAVATLTATQTVDGLWLRWTGDVASEDRTVELVMDGAKNVTANFYALDDEKYASVDYIESTKGDKQHIDTGICAQPYITLDIDYEWKPLNPWTYGGMFGAYAEEGGVTRGLYLAYTSSTHNFGIKVENNNVWEFTGGGAEAGVRYHVVDTVFSSTVSHTVNGATSMKGLDRAQKNHSETCYLFAYNVNGNPGGVLPSRLYEAKVYTNATSVAARVLARDYRPCYNRETRQYGVYDLVTETFSPSLAAKGFVGPKVHSKKGIVLIVR